MCNTRRAGFLWEKKIPCSVVVHKRRAASFVRSSDQKAKQRPVELINEFCLTPESHGMIESLLSFSIYYNLD